MVDFAFFFWCAGREEVVVNGRGWVLLDFTSLTVSVKT